ncbi:MAG: hypothetical protein ACO1OQ_09250 [Rufibacter sp.]
MNHILRLLRMPLPLLLLLILSCDEDKEPQPDMGLLFGKWKVVSYEGVPNGRMQPSSLKPFKETKGDSLFWLFSQDGKVSYNEIFAFSFTPRQRGDIPVPGDTVATVPIPVTDTLYIDSFFAKWTIQQDILTVDRLLRIDEFKIEKLTPDSLVLLRKEKSTIDITLQDAFTVKARFARWK